MIDYLPSLPSPISNDEAKLISPLVLAFVGDGVHTLFVRSSLVLTTTLKTNDLHKLTADKVKAVSQAKLIEEIMPMLTEEEIAIFKRGRNSSPNTMAKNASVAEYKKASGFEALVGYLYLTGQHERLHKLLLYSTKVEEEK